MSGKSSRIARRAQRTTDMATNNMKAENAALTGKNNRAREQAQLKQIRALRARFGGGFTFGGQDNLSSTLG